MGGKWRARPARAELEVLLGLPGGIKSKALPLRNKDLAGDPGVRSLGCDGD